MGRKDHNAATKTLQQPVDLTSSQIEEKGERSQNNPGSEDVAEKTAPMAIVRRFKTKLEENAKLLVEEDAVEA